MSKRELPLFTVSHNPLIKGKENINYIIVHHRDEGKRATVRAGDWAVLEGEISADLIERAQQWYFFQ
jgi:hypothetical protein